MLKQRARLMTFMIVLFDVAVVVYAFFFSYSFRDSLQTPGRSMVSLTMYLQFFLPVVPLWTLFSYSLGLYQSQRMRSPAKEIVQLAKVGALFFVTLSVLSFAFGLHFVSRLFTVAFAASSFVFVVAAHVVLRLVLRYYRRRGHNFRTVAIVGAGEQAVEMARIVLDHVEWGLRFAGYILPAEAPRTCEHSPCLGEIGNLAQIMQANVIDEVVFATPREKLDEMEEALLHCEDLGVSTKVVLNIFPHRISKAEVEEIGGVSMLSFTNTPQNLLALGVKRSLDVVGSLIALVLASPVLAAVAIAIKVTSPGPVLFGQKRTGRNGREFTLYKFRSMVAGAEKMRRELEELNEMDGPVFKIKHDPRITRIGKFIRKTSIDEFPQFFNVLAGDMSLVGPRPLPTYEVAQFKHWHRRRLSVKPGITCYWQISGRNKLKNFESDILPLDLKYIDNWSLTEDLKIILRTIPAVLLGRGAS